MGNEKEGIFLDIEKKLLKQEILLPDFQRGFKWTDDEKQIAIVASVLVRLPIGNILLIESKANEYGAKIIGSKTKLNLDNKDEEKKVQFLLDGQQRITVLTNAFSDIVLDLSGTYDNLISTKLKKRFFLKIPKWKKCYEVNGETNFDLFNLAKLDFPFNEGDDNLTLVTEQIREFIVMKDINHEKNGRNVSQESGKLSKLLHSDSETESDYYFIPLFTFIRFSKNGEIDGTKNYAFNTMFDTLKAHITDEIMDYYNQLNNEKDIKCLINSFQPITEKLRTANAGNNKNEFKETIHSLVSSWTESFKKYLENSINNMDVSKNVLKDNQRERAICMYTNMNQTSVKLDTFDLLTARVARCNNENYIDSIKKCLSKNNYNNYNVNFLDDGLRESLEELNKKIKGYNASNYFSVYKESDLKPSFVRNFLRIIYLYSKKKDFNYDSLSTESIYGGTTKALLLSPQEIFNNTNIVCNALDRTFYFFQTNCGLRRIEEVNYDAMITVVASIFLNNEWFNSKDIHKKLKAWYWSSIFTGRYDKDQKRNMLNDITFIYKSIKSNDWSWLNERISNIFKNEYSNKKRLLNEIETDIPKVNVRYFICQWYLSKGYKALFEKDRYINVFENSNDLEIHHIIPLSEATSYKESTSRLRDDTSNFYNSPLNFVMISKDENEDIGGKSFADYTKTIDYSKLDGIGVFIQTNDKDERIIKRTKEDHRQILSDRFDKLSSDVYTTLEKLMK